jgi:hypothetical protein
MRTRARHPPSGGCRGERMSNVDTKSINNFNFVYIVNIEEASLVINE